MGIKHGDKHRIPRHLRDNTVKRTDFSMNSEFTILLADADQDFHDVVTDYLKNTGTRMIACSSGKAVLSSIQAEKPDLLFMSDNLKDVSCLSFCRKMKTDRNASSIPIIAVLSANRGGDREYCYEAGCSDVLLKPVERGDFFATLRKFVNLEKRFNPRFRSPSKINCSLQYSITHDCRVYDISAGGLFLESCPPMPLNTLVALNFTLPESTITISCNARVAWINHPIALSKIDFPFGVGVEFVELSRETSDKLAAYLSGTREEPGTTQKKMQAGS